MIILRSSAAFWALTLVLSTSAIANTDMTITCVDLDQFAARAKKAASDILGVSRGSDVMIKGQVTLPVSAPPLTVLKISVAEDMGTFTGRAEYTSSKGDQVSVEIHGEYGIVAAGSNSGASYVLNVVSNDAKSFALPMLNADFTASDLMLEGSKHSVACAFN